MTLLHNMKADDAICLYKKLTVMVINHALS